MQSTVLAQWERTPYSRENLDFANRLFLHIPDPEKKALALSELGSLYHELYGELRRTADLERAISLYEEAVRCTSAIRKRFPMGLGAALWDRFGQKGDVKDIDKAIQLYQNALSLLGDGNPNKPAFLSNLGAALQTRFKLLGSLEDIEISILSNQRTVDLTPDEHPDKPTYLSNLGNSLQARFERFGSLKDLENAIFNQQKAVDLTPYGNPDKPRHLSNLGTSLQARFKRLGSLEDLNNAILSNQRAVDLLPDGHPLKPPCLSNLGCVLITRFYCLGSLSDLENAVLSNQKALDLAPDGHSDRLTLLFNLGKMLQAHFDRHGRLTDLENAILNKQKVVDLTPDAHPNKPACLSSLANALQVRFERLSSLTDLENAILSQQRAVDLTPDDHPNKAHYLSNLGNALEMRFERLGSLKDLQNAILTKQKAVDLTPDGHQEKPARLNNLGIALGTRFDRLGNVIDLENAILSKEKAVDLMPDGHLDKPGLVSNLGVSLKQRFNRFGNVKDLDKAILNNQMGVDLTPDGHPDKPNHLTDLGSALAIRSVHTNNPKDLEGAIRVYSQAAMSPIGRPIVRFRAACAWGNILGENSRSSLLAYCYAIDLLPRIAWLGLPVTDQHALLVEIGSIAFKAVSIAIHLDELETAVVWAEQRRSIVWQNMLGLRTPLDDLRVARPQLADKIQHIARQMETSNSHDVTNVNPNSSRLAIDWENTVEEIRKVPGFEGFLKAKAFSQLAPAADEGPVAILNVDDTRSDALVLIADDSMDKHVSVVHIPLTRFSYEKGQKLCAKLTELLNLANARDRGEPRMTGRLPPDGSADSAFRKILRILWLDVVQPVIDALGYQAQPEHLPHIWWCATGPLAFLPIHAAGMYDSEMGEKLSDYVVSSYTPTLTAILDLSAPKVEHDFTILTVAQPNTPNATPIPKTEDEVKIVQGLASGVNVIGLKDEAATVEHVLQAMRETDWVHLACHGKQMIGDPMKSGLLLQDKILELSEIVKHALPRADFAFLSACQTAVGDERIADESVHLAAGMFMAGYRSVIATMWAIKDKDAPKIAEDVYKRILKGGRPNRKEAAHALHDAVKRLRDSGAKFVDWVPFIHLGR